MVGVNIDKLDNIISKLEDLADSSSSDFRNINNSLSDLSGCYSGQSLNYIFNFPAKEINGRDVILNYIKTLEAVKQSYIRQDEIFRDQIEHVNSRLN